MSEEKFSGKSFVSLRLLKKVGIIGLSVALATLIVIAAFSLLHSSNKSFSIHFDKSEDVHLVVSTKPDGSDAGTFFLGNPLVDAGQVDGLEVYSRLEEINDLAELTGPTNFYSKDSNDQEYLSAMLFTVYLTNTGEEEETYTASLNLDAQEYDSKVAPIEYYRVLFAESDVDETQKADVNLKTKVYGAKTNQVSGTPMGDDDTREAVSSYKNNIAPSGHTVRVADVNINGQEYCEPFISSNVGQSIVRHEITVPSNTTRRLTFVGYFEGFDPDGYGEAPNRAFLLMSLHLGK